MIVFIFTFLVAAESPSAAHNVTVYFFWGEGCPHCMHEKEFLSQLVRKYPLIEIKSFEVWYNRENAMVFTKISQLYGKNVEGVPTTFIGDFEPIVGYLNQETTGKDIEEKARYCIQHGCADPLTKLRGPAEQKGGPPRTVISPFKKEPQGSVLEPGEAKKQPMESEKPVTLKKEEETKKEAPKQAELPEKKEILPGERTTFTIPMVGEVDPSNLSLPVFTIIIAGLDGFNPCAFFVLFLLLSILIYAHSRKIMLVIGGTFVFFSGFIYFLFMAAWLNVFLLFGQLKIMTLAAGILAVIVALINIKDFFFFEKGVSLMIPEKAKPKLFERTRNILKKGSLPSMMLGTVVLAIAANTYELLCTAGFPMVYTRALTLYNLSRLQYYLYLVFYNLIYVVPLTVIVLLFSITLGARKLTEWQGQVLKLISGLMMLSLGLVLLTKPDLLNNILVSGGMLALSLITAGMIIFMTKRLKQGRDR
jgi:thiol-disulfide isomerase/thioredoxin